MNAHRQIRVRFAPSPTGLMHLGNVRIALMNYLFAQQKQGTFIVRIEDTDPTRNFDPGAQHIQNDLSWLNLSYQEGPGVGGPYAPYFQSQRYGLYDEQLKKLQEKGLIYRCFCTQEELDKKRQRQVALKLPPRYDRTCTKLSEKEIAANLHEKKPFIWRFKIDHDDRITITDLAHGPITFEMKNFSDFPLTRADGSSTFMFANFVDDMLMQMSHVLRGEDHLSNTAGQAALYKAFEKELPVFWHLPILCNIDGKKLSKRDFGFSLGDLKQAGFLPEAITNYLALIGGGTFEQEILSLEELARESNFESINATGHIKYDVEKLRWINHKWIDRLDPIALYERALPFLRKSYSEVDSYDRHLIINALQLAKTEAHTLTDFQELLTFLFKEPHVDSKAFAACISPELLFPIASFVKEHIPSITADHSWLNYMKDEAKKHKLPIKELFWFMRIALTGKPHGPGIQELIGILGKEAAQKRFENAVSAIKS